MTPDDKRERVAKIQGLAVLASVFIGLAMMALIAYMSLTVWFCRFHEWSPTEWNGPSAESEWTQYSYYSKVQSL